MSDRYIKCKICGGEVLAQYGIDICQECYNKEELKGNESVHFNNWKYKEEYRKELRETKGVIIYTLPSGRLQFRKYNPLRRKK